jgi:hypothetical protein
MCAIVLNFFYPTRHFVLIMLDLHRLEDLTCGTELIKCPSCPYFFFLLRLVPAPMARAPAAPPSPPPPPRRRAPWLTAVSARARRSSLGRGARLRRPMRDSGARSRRLSLGGRSATELATAAYARRRSPTPE